MADRVLTAASWLTATTNTPQTPDGPLTKLVLGALASVVEPNMQSTMNRASHWPHADRPMLGAMWLGVVRPTYAYRDAGGCWVVQTHPGHGLPATSYMRFVPAGDGETQYGFCPMRLDRRESMLQALFPDGRVRLSNCVVRTESSAMVRVDKMVVTAARLQDAETGEGGRFRELLGRLRVPLGDLIEDMFRNVYSDRSTSILHDRSEDYRDVVHLLVDRSYPGTLPPATMKDVNRFLACVDQPPPYTWTPETIFPYLGSVVLPNEVYSKVARNLEQGLPPIVPQWATAQAHQFNGPWANPCTGIQCGGRDCKILAGVTNSFNTDLMGPLCYWPPDWHPHPDWLGAYMEVLDEAHTMAMPIDINHRTDLLLETARKVPVILQGRAGPTYARVMSFEFSSGRTVSDVVIRSTNAVGELLPASDNPVVEILPDSSPDLEEGLAECVNCGQPWADLNICRSCGDDICHDCWFGQCSGCGLEMCSTCWESHSCEETDNE